MNRWSVHEWGTACLSSIGMEYADDTVYSTLRTLHAIEDGKIPGLAPDALDTKMRALEASISKTVSREAFKSPWNSVYGAWRKAFDSHVLTLPEMENFRREYGKWMEAYRAEPKVAVHKTPKVSGAPMFSTQTTILLTIGSVGAIAVGMAIFKHKLIMRTLRSLRDPALAPAPMAPATTLVMPTIPPGFALVPLPAQLPKST